MLAIEWFDKVKAAKQIPSDNMLAKELGVTRQYISHFRTGTSRTVSAKVAMKIAEALGVPAMEVIQDQIEEAEKAGSYILC